jgi:uncharacterized protein YjiS (DUF1127 family)
MNANSTVSASSTSSFDPSGTSRWAGVLSEGARTALAAAAMPIERAADLFVRWRRRVADREHLLTLDDGMLRDIGLSRADIEVEASKPFWRG